MLISAPPIKITHPFSIVILLTLRMFPVGGSPSSLMFTAFYIAMLLSSLLLKRFCCEYLHNRLNVVSTGHIFKLSKRSTGPSYFPSSWHTSYSYFTQSAPWALRTNYLQCCSYNYQPCLLCGPCFFPSFRPLCQHSPSYKTVFFPSLTGSLTIMIFFMVFWRFAQLSIPNPSFHPKLSSFVEICLRYR